VKAHVPAKIVRREITWDDAAGARGTSWATPAPTRSQVMMAPWRDPVAVWLTSQASESETQTSPNRLVSPALA
jgi:hypothetical protein